MKYARDMRPDGASTQSADVLVEALPWIKNVTGKTVVIKYGGSAMVDEQLRADVMADIVLLKIVGVNPVIVHGGGRAITETMERFGLPVEFKDGQRVTSPAAMEVVRMVLMGKVNQELVETLNAHGNFAVGVSGADAGVIVAKQADPELGRVGSITRINRPLLDDLVEGDYIPVVASVALGEDGGFYNVNADMVAGHIAAAIGAHKVIFLTDVDGLYENFDDKDTLISNLTLFEAQYMVENDMVSTGMIPKLRSCIHALDAGVFRAHIINGTTPHALLLELLTNTGVGTTCIPPRRRARSTRILWATSPPALENRPRPRKLAAERRGHRRTGPAKGPRPYRGKGSSATRERTGRRACEAAGTGSLCHEHVRPQAGGAGARRGMAVFDDEGPRIPRLHAGIGAVSLGHCHPALSMRCPDQAEKLVHVSNYYYVEHRGEVAALLSDLLNQTGGARKGRGAVAKLLLELGRRGERVRLQAGAPACQEARPRRCACLRRRRGRRPRRCRRGAADHRHAGQQLPRAHARHACGHGATRQAGGVPAPARRLRPRVHQRRGRLGGAVCRAGGCDLRAHGGVRPRGERRAPLHGRVPAAARRLTRSAAPCSCATRSNGRLPVRHAVRVPAFRRGPTW